MKMPTEKMDTAMFAPCGMNCLVCYKHCYHKKPCAGCLNSDMGKPEHCRKCKIKDCTKGIRRALWRTASLFVSTVWKGSWNSRKGNILVQNAEVSFLSMTESAASVKKA